MTDPTPTTDDAPVLPPYQQIENYFQAQTNAHDVYNHIVDACFLESSASTAVKNIKALWDDYLAGYERIKTFEENLEDDNA